MTRAAANKAGDEIGGAGGLALQLISGIKGMSEQADTRSWSTLPMTIQVARLWVKPGSQDVFVDSRLGRLGPYSLNLEPGQTGLIYVRDTGGFAGHYTAVLEHGRQSSYQREGSGIGATDAPPAAPVAAVPESSAPRTEAYREREFGDVNTRTQPSAGSHADAYGESDASAAREPVTHADAYEAESGSRRRAEKNDSKKPTIGVF
jgi:hypothetical protein